MFEWHYEKYLARNFRLDSKHSTPSGVIMSGRLIRRDGAGPAIPITDGIPRFVTSDNYAHNFGVQWNEFRSTQLDSASGRPVTAERLWACTRWRPSDLRGKHVLEIGSGAGRFTELLVATGANVVSMDFSTAVDANYKNNGGANNLFLFQGDLYNLPLDEQLFDFVLCYGVLQHTPRPEDAFHAVIRNCKPHGKASLDFYRRFPFPTAWTTPKYLWRPLTTRLRPDVLLRLVRAYVPWYLPIDTFFRRRGRAGVVILGLIPVPCWNHVHLGLSDQQRTEWAIMDTFDALGARYDRPFKKSEIENFAATLQATHCEVFYGGQGIVCNLII